MAAEHIENIRFSQFIENYPCLYDHTNKGYANKNTTEKAWSEISREFKLSVKECKDKWKNIRTVFRRHLFDKPSSGSGASSKKEYYLHDVLQFLVPILKDSKKPTASNLPAPSPKLIDNIDGSEQDPNDTENGATNSGTLESDVEGNFPECCTENDDPNILQPNANQSIADFRKSQARKRKALDPLDDAMTNYFKMKTISAENLDTQSDEKFLLSLKSDMKDMNAQQKRRFKSRLYDLIDEILSDKPPNKPLEHTSEPEQLLEYVPEYLDAEFK